MIRVFTVVDGRLQAIPAIPDSAKEIIWFDLYAPAAEEEKQVEDLVGVDLPTREEMEEIEISSRLYYDDDTAYMTVMLPAGTERGAPEMGPVTFVLRNNRLVTLRHHEPQAFLSFPERAGKFHPGSGDAPSVLIALLDAIVDRLADILERAGRDIDGISREIFQRSQGPAAGVRDYQKVLRHIALAEDLTSSVRDSLATLERMFAFLSQDMLDATRRHDLRIRLKALVRDAESLSDHVDYLSQKIAFLLDAMLGLVNIEQNATIKIFSVAAVVFLPPTLIASIYGMNFHFMPELSWNLGYPLAIGLMLASAALPYLYFKRRGWL